MQIRIAEPDDAPAIVEFLNVLYLETEYMLFEDGEFTVTSEQQRKQIETRTKEGTGVIFLCLHETRIVGILFGYAFQPQAHLSHSLSGPGCPTRVPPAGYRLPLDDGGDRLGGLP
jgi:hypothetical protein